MIGYIRQNIYKNYPYKSLSTSSLLSDFRFEQLESDTDYLQIGKNGMKLPYKWNWIYKLYFKDKFIVELSNLEIKAFDSKNNKKILRIKK